MKYLFLLLLVFSFKFAKAESNLNLSVSYLNVSSEISDVLETGTHYKALLNTEDTKEILNDLLSFVGDNILDETFGISPTINYINFSSDLSQRDAQFYSLGLELTKYYKIDESEFKGFLHYSFGALDLTYPTGTKRQYENYLAFGAGYAYQVSEGHHLGLIAQIATITDKKYPIQHNGLGVSYEFSF